MEIKIPFLPFFSIQNKISKKKNNSILEKKNKKKKKKINPK